MKNILLTTIITVVLISTNVFASEIQFITHSAEEQTKLDEKGELRGLPHAGRRAFCVELIREMMEIVKVPKVINQVPLVRGMYYVQEEDNYAFFNVTRTPERENTVKWVGPIELSTPYFFEMKNAPTGIKTFEDAKEVKTIAVVRGGVVETFLKGKGFDNMYPVTSYTQCFEMLKAGRVNLTVPGDTPLLERLRDAGISPDEIQQTPVVVMKSSGFLAFSKNIPDEVVRQWQAAFDQIKESGKYDELYNLYHE